MYKSFTRTTERFRLRDPKFDKVTSKDLYLYIRRNGRILFEKKSGGEHSIERKSISHFAGNLARLERQFRNAVIRMKPRESWRSRRSDDLTSIVISGKVSGTFGQACTFQGTSTPCRCR